MYYNKRHSKSLSSALSETIYESLCKAKNEISNAVNYKNWGKYIKRYIWNFI